MIQYNQRMVFQSQLLFKILEQLVEELFNNFFSFSNYKSLSVEDCE